MRGVLFAVLLLAAAAQAHGPGDVHGDPLPYGTYLNHLVPWQVDLAPGDQANETLAFEGTAMPEGWLLVVHGVVANGTVEVRLVDDGALAAWTWAAGSHTETVRLQHTGFPRFEVLNVGDTNTSLTLSYDQTCDCLGKATALERGPLLFNVDAHAGDHVRFRFTFVPVRATFDTPAGDFAGTLRVEARRVAADPQGALTVLEARAAVFSGQEDCAGMGRFSGCMDVGFVANETGRQVILMQVAHDMPGWVTQVRPVVDVQPADQAAPGPGAWVLLVVAGAAWRWRP